MIIDHAFILAAGLGKRLRPYTDTLPKPLVPVAGRPIIDHVIDRLVEAGVKRIVVNLHYRGDMIERHLSARRDADFAFSWEDELLETGGGMKKALPLLGHGPFFSVSGDSFWTDGKAGAALSRMGAAWDPAKADLLLMLQPLSRMVLTEGRGDYNLKPDGHAVRSLDKSGDYMWSSVRLCEPKLFNDTPDGAFSFLTLMDRAEAAGRLYGVEHDGDWHHISTPSDLECVNEHMAAHKAYA